MWLEVPSFRAHRAPLSPLKPSASVRATTLVGAALTAVVGGALALTLADHPLGKASSARATVGEAPSIEDLRAGPLSTTEGSWVELVSSASAVAGGLLRYRWDFGDGSGTREGAGLTSVRHQYPDGSQNGSVFTVTLRVTDSAGRTAERRTRVLVRNVAPEILTMDRDGRALVGEPVTFRGVAFDPGLEDELTFHWGFGDGGEAAGSSASHSFQEEGPHEVTLTVTDGDGGRDERTLSVVVGRGYTYTASGDVSARQEGRVSVYGIPGNTNATNAILREGHCVLTLFFNPAGGVSDVQEAGSGLGITASLRGGLRKGSFPFGADRSIRVRRDEGQNPDFFFASLTTARRAPQEIMNAFGSASGTLTIDYVDDGWVEGSFVVAMRESPPLDYPPRIRTANLQGSFAASLERKPGTQDFYACSVPETLRIEHRSPAVDAVNVDPQSPVVEVGFSSPVDRSSFRDGTVRLEYRLPTDAGAAYRAIDGAFSFIDERTVRFTPTAPLPDGTLLCLRFRGGESGVRGADGEILETSPPPTGETAPGETGSDQRVGRRAVGSRTVRACRAGGRPWEEADEWSFGTMVELESLRTELYQVARIDGDAISLVPHKATVARVYAGWEEKDGVHPDVQVLRFPASVWVDADGHRVYPARSDVELRRPDLYDVEDRRFARNSVNFFGWKPGEGGPVAVRAHVEPSDQSRDPPRLFDGPAADVPRWEHHPGLVFDYYFLRIGAWTDEVPSRARAGGRILAKRSEIYTTQMFPVIGTVGRRGGDFQIGFLDQASAERRQIGASLLDNLAVYYDMPGGFRREARQNQVSEDLYTLIRIFTDQVAPYTDANALVAFAPAGYTSGGTSWLPRMVKEALAAGGGAETWGFPFRTITLNPRGDIYRTSALAHEFGHSFWLQHVPEVADADARSLECAQDRGVMGGIEGFRVSPSGLKGASKSSRHGNAEARRLYALMYPCTQLSTESFVTNAHYAALQEDIGAAIRRGIFSGRAIAASSGDRARRLLQAGVLPLASHSRGAAPAPQNDQRDASILVSGFVGLEGDGGTEAAGLLPVRTVEGAVSGSSRPIGPYRVRLRDEDGHDLRGVDFGPLGESADGAAPGEGYFSVALPRPDGLREVVVERAGRRLTGRSVSPNAPSVRITAPGKGAVVSAPFTLRWRGEDADGDVLDYTVLYSPSGRRPWRAVGAFLRAEALTLDPTLLDPGPAPTLRVIANDGLREGEATVTIALTTPVAVLATVPAAGDTVDADVEPMVFFGSDVDEAEVEGALQLRAPEGSPVPTNVLFDPTGRSAVIVPLEPLTPGASYVLSVSKGLNDRHGSRLEEEVAVPFLVAPGPTSPLSAPADAVASPPTPAEKPATGQPSEEEADALGYGGVRWVSLRVPGDETLSFSGSGVDGSAGVSLFCTPGSQASVTIFDAADQEDSTLGLTLTTEGIVAPGATGSFRLESLLLVARATGLVFEGDGTLEVTRHDAPAEPNGQRLTGRVRGAVLTHEGAERITLDLDFDVNAGCRSR